MKVNEQSLFEEKKEKSNKKSIFLVFSLFLCNQDTIHYLEKNDVDLKDYP